MNVAELHIYPVKGLQGISLTSSRFDKRGLAFDRRFMLVDESGNFLSQRKLPIMATISTRIEGNNLSIFHAGFGGFEVALEALEGEENLRTTDVPVMPVQVWKSELIAPTVSEVADRWLSEMLQQKVHLVYMPKNLVRRPNQEFAQATDEVSFADGYPILLVNLASLKNLNQELGKKGIPTIPISRFRANIVVESSAPWEEDEWKSIQINENHFRNAKPCGRCQVITLDQETGLGSSSAPSEPLRTLSEIRTLNGNANFGINLIPDKNLNGKLTIGDSLQATK